MLEAFKDAIRDDIEELVTIGRMRKAIEVSIRTRQHFNHNEYPLYFTGKLDARLVVVHLNPWQRDNFADVYQGELRFKTFEEYFEYHQHYGKHKYGPASRR